MKMETTTITKGTASAPASNKVLFQPAPAAVSLDMSYVQARPLKLLQTNKISLVVVGLGGTGSWVASSIGQVGRTLLEASRDVEIEFWDFDIVEPANVLRQNFCYAEVGAYKASTLALRYGAAWGLEIAAHCQPFSHDSVKLNSDRLIVVIGCVDNAAARQEIAAVLSRNVNLDVPHIWWLDAGNTRDAGQVLLGSDTVEYYSTKKADRGKGTKHGKFLPEEPIITTDLVVAYTFAKLPGYSTRLPSPALQAPDLLVPRPEEAIANAQSNNLSCEQMALFNAQSLMVNKRVGAEVGDYLLRMLVSGDLKRFQTFMDLPSGVSRSTYITQENVTRVVTDGIEQF